MAVNYTDVQKTEKYISRTNFDALEMAAVPEGTEFNIVDQIHESDLDSDVLQKLNNNAKINTANTFTAVQTFKKDITIEGNIIQNGSAYETHAEKLYTKNDMIYTRDGATAALADNAYTGIQAVKYDGTNDGQLVFGKDGIARVGDVGHTQPLATRAEKDALTDGHILRWDAAGQTLVDSGKSVSDLEGGGGDVTAAGSNIFTGLNSFRLNTTFGGTGESASDPVITVDSGAIRFRYNGLFDCGQLVADNANDKNLTYKYNDAVVKFPKKSGTIAIIGDLPEANPTAAGTVTLTKLKIGDTVYNLPSGGGDITAADALNIQNGSGIKSIQQVKNTDGTTIPIKTKNPNAVAQGAPEEVEIGATGESAAVFGGAAAATAKRAFAAGTSTAALGKYSAAFGDNSVALGNESFVANSVTTASGQGASAFGNSTIASGYNSFAEGNSTVASGQVSHAAGTGTRATSNNQFVIGKYNAEDNNAIFIIGTGTDESNRINGFVVNKGGVAFSNNHQLATNEYVDNSIEFLKSSIKDSVITQTLNVGRSDNNNVVSQGASAAIGLGLNTNAYAQTVLGRYNKPDADAFFIVGNGTPEIIQNAFEVLNDGRAKVQSAPKDNDDIVRKLELDTKQATLVSGTNIKTINGNSLLGSGDLTIAGGGGDITLAGDNTFTGSNTFTKDFSVYDEVSGNRATLGYNALTLEGPIINETCMLSPAGLEHRQMDADGETILNKTTLEFEKEEGSTTATITVPNKTGTLALTSDVVANPTAPGTTPLARLKIGNTIYSIPGGGGLSGHVYLHRVSFDIVSGDTKGYFTTTNNESTALKSLSAAKFEELLGKCFPAAINGETYSGGTVSVYNSGNGTLLVDGVVLASAGQATSYLHKTVNIADLSDIVTQII